MMRLLTIMLLAICIAPDPSTAAALKYKSTKGTETVITPRWLHAGDGLSPDQMNALVAELGGVELKIDVSAYVGRPVRVYLALPLAVKGLRGTSGLRVEWKTRGLLMAGDVVPGNRTLVYQGIAPAREMGDVFDFLLFIDGRHFLGGLGFDPVFEVEVLPK